MKPRGIRYLVGYCPEAEHDAGTLEVVNMLTGNVFWFDNENMEWHKSIYPADEIIKDIGLEFEEVESFDNGYVNTADIWDGVGYTSLIDRCPEEFVLNFSQEEAEYEN